MEKIKLVLCPHCNVSIDPTQLNCKIYRCGVYKLNNEPINPHLEKVKCDELVLNNLINGSIEILQWGAFKIIGVKDEFYYETEKCGYE